MISIPSSQALLTQYAMFSQAVLSSGFTLSPFAVSYTHLDVYKRQALSYRLRMMSIVGADFQKKAHCILAYDLRPVGRHIHHRDSFFPVS